MYIIKFSKLLVTFDEVRNLESWEHDYTYQTLKHARKCMVGFAQEFYIKHKDEGHFVKYLTDNDHAKRREVFTIREGERFVYRVDIVSA